MRITKLTLVAVACICGLAFCPALSAQNPPDTQGAAAPVSTVADPNATPNPTISDPSETQYPHQQKSPPSQVVSPEIANPINWNGYDTHVAIEIGGRTAAVTGNRDVYATFVNLQPGPRLLDQSLEMHSVNHDGPLFDDLSLSSFGIGGDPNEFVRMRVNKHHWYDLNGNWRRDLNFWDYNLIGNPLNPLNNNPSVPINVSPHLLDLSRKLLDLNLTLLPDWPVQLNMGFSHYTNGGGSYTTIHESTDTQIYQPWRDSSDSIRFGIAWRPVARTRISFDEFYSHNKNDNRDVLTSFPYALSNGTGVNLGIIFGNNSPCAAPFLASGAINPTCSLFTGYSDVVPYYTNIPTEQLGFDSSYFRRLHVSGRASYTGAETNMPNGLEVFNGYNNQRVQTTIASHSYTKQITTSADGGVTYDITERLSFDDQFRWYAYRIPGSASLVQTYLFGASALITGNPYNPATCPPPYTAATCPQHGTSTSADVTATNYAMYNSQNQKRNTVQLRYDLAKASAYAGYRFERQDIVIDTSSAAIATYFPNKPNRGSCTAPLVNSVCTLVGTPNVSAGSVEINTHGAVFGVNARPLNGLRLNADAELTYADNVFSNIMPRHIQLYRGKATYTPRKWIDLNANIRIQEERNLAGGLGNLQHNRSYSFGTIFPISPRFGVEANYSYDNFLSNMNICFVETPKPGFASTSPLCPSSLLFALSYYRNVDHFVSGDVMFKPLSRATITAGYTVVSTNGATLLLNPLAPLGPVAINYHLPTASVAINFTKQFALKGGWNIYDYREKSLPGPVAPRNFEANVVSVSLRYTM